MSDLPECANPLYLQWVKELWDQAKERSYKSAPTFGKAFHSLKTCPIKFDHPSQCKQLSFWGPKLCEDIAKKLKEHCDANGLPMPEPKKLNKKNRDALDSGEDDDEETPQPAKKPRKTKAYVPAYRSGAYAILLAFATLAEDDNRGLSKADLIEAAQPHCDASFTAPADATKFYTAWASMKTLQTKELVYQKGGPLKRYCLSDEGREVARRVREIAQQKDALPGRTAQRSTAQALDPGPERGRVHANATRSPDDDDDIFIAEPNTADKTLPAPAQQAYADVVPVGEGDAEGAIPQFTPIRLPPGSFQVRLVLDNREVRTMKDRDYVREELSKKGVVPLVRSVALGDAMWVAKCTIPGLLPDHGIEGGDEAVLDYVCERKRLDDLISSIKDGRFHEQKFRLRRSGVRNVIYLVEEITMDAGHFSKYEEAVQSAMATIQVVEGYFLKQTQKLDDTIRYLTRMTKMLKEMHEKKTLYVVPTAVLTAQNYLPLIQHLRETQPASSHHITYPAFASLASKSEMMTLRDVFLKMLMCTRGVTGEKALEIQKRWKTPYHFVKAFEACGPGEEGKKRKRELVANEMSNLVGRKKIAKAVSQTIAEVWGDV
ncbi:Crossover junction endonuclease MUS81 [Coniochaeta hoffmannii]|uniref:Crossover junction endonuclease MUS81 n=1 Tax=Coniochaeta hoffmannii TaxID=91930 RepID=A0AA38VSV5_9PEZI|nr:Crossover junction endonuclease MUS81 [Coniochaeta hoffmannii]